ncbi:hypothetical protein D3C72_1985380 [compost metagenome]
MRGLSGGFPFCGGFDAVVHRVADDVHQGVSQRQQQVPVQACLAPEGLEADVLAQRLGGIPDGPVEARGEHGGRKQA